MPVLSAVNHAEECRPSFSDCRSNFYRSDFYQSDRNPRLSKMDRVLTDLRLQSYPRKMFAADFQPSWPSRPQTKGTLLFYFLKLYNFGFDEIFVGLTSSEVQHPWISKIRCEPKKSQKNHFSGSILKYF